jgi:thyrotropin-releasing hormone receptor
LADLLLLLSAALPATAQPFYIRDEWPWGHALCSLVVFVQYLGANASALSITAFTIERYIAICHPMKAQIMCTTERAKKIIIALWCFAVCILRLFRTTMITNIFPTNPITKITMAKHAANTV